MIFWFLKITLPVFIRVFYRRIHLSGTTNIPKGKPVFIAANHPNSFLDGVMVSLLLRRYVYVLVRGDVFKKKWANYVLRRMKLLPIFRSQDGDPRENIVRNNELADRIYAIFKKKGIVLIFSEAIARCEKRLRPLRKGTARMAFELEERSNYNLDLYIVPAGINYTYFRGYRKELMLNFGEAISVADWKESYIESQSTAITKLTGVLSEKITEQVVIINDPEHDHLIDTALNIQRTIQAFPFLNFFNRSDKRLTSELSVADRLNEALQDEEQPLKAKLIQYIKWLKEYGIDERSFSAATTSVFRLFWAVLLSVPALIGYLVYGWIYVYSWKKSVRVVKRDEFFDSVLFGISFALSLLQTAVLGLLLILFLGWSGFSILVFLILSGFAFLGWKGIVRTYILKRKWERFLKQNPSRAKELKHLRNEIIQELEMDNSEMQMQDERLS